MNSSLEERVFTLVALTVVLGMTATSLAYRAPARLVPLVIGGATSAILIFLTVTLFVPRVGRWWRGVGGGSFLDAVPEDEKEVEAERAEARRKRVLEFRVLAWLVALTALVYFFGFLPSIAVFLVAFLRVAGRESWKTSLLIATSVWGVIYLVFVVALGIRLYGGILFGS